MKVIKEGKLPEDIYHGTCTKCGAIVEANTSESIEVGDRYSGPVQRKVMCPTAKCGHFIFLTEGKYQTYIGNPPI